MKSKYPIIANIIINLANNSGHLEKPEAELILAIVNHTKQVYNSAIKRNSSHYYKRTVGELDSQVFPNMPLLKERAKYDKTCKTEDSRAWKKLCEKTFPTHKNLTPGLFIVTCACSFKVVYGFSMMLSGESPQMLFDIIMTRFEEDYNPNIIYDASCKLKDRHGKSLKKMPGLNFFAVCKKCGVKKNFFFLLFSPLNLHIISAQASHYTPFSHPPQKISMNWPSWLIQSLSCNVRKSSVCPSVCLCHR